MPDFGSLIRCRGVLRQLTVRSLPLITAIVLLGSAGPAAAQDPPHDGAESPWSVGVSEENKAKARTLLERGNELFLQADYREALVVYRQALESWDHPAIRFNIVRTLINLDKPLEAYENLELALAYGAAPLGEGVHREALNYRRLLQGQIAEVTIRCEQASVEVTLDGNRILGCPGETKSRVTPGYHAVVGKLPGHLTLTREVLLLPGKGETVDVTLVSLADAVTVRRWTVWKPWAVVGSGAVVTGLGGLLLVKARDDLDEFRDRLNMICAPPEGCAPEEVPESSAETLHNVAVGTMIVGGAVIVTGMTLVLMNQPRPVTEETIPAARTQVVPAVSGDGVQLTIVRRF